MNNTRKCIDCVNFLVIDDNKELATCDYDYFIDKKIQDAILFVPELFDCDDYEEIKE